MENGRIATLVMGAGESRRLYMTRGDALLATEGRLVLRGPAVWLGETLMTPETTMEAEQRWLAAADAWVEIFAPRGARLLALPSSHGDAG